MENQFDVVVIGAGPAGTTSAKILAENGKKVALVEDTHIGGTCVNCGCIPTKFLLAASAPLGELHDQKRFSVLSGEVDVDFSALQKRKERFCKGTAQALSKSLTSLGVSIFNGRGRGIAPGTVEITGEYTAILKANDIILATGSHSASFPGLEADGKAVLDSTMLLKQETIPKSLIIIGAGAIGIEFSDFFSALGTKVTIVEAVPQIIPTEDADVAETLRKIVEKSGRVCITGRKVSSLVTVDGQAVLTFEDGEKLVAEKGLVAVGRRPNTKDLGVEALGGKLNKRGFVEVGDDLSCSPHCYAVGDVNGLTLLAHAGDHQAEWVARKILGKEKAEKYLSGPVPSCIFGHIEVMRVGCTAKEVFARGGKVYFSQVPLSTNPIAQAHGATTGFAKAVWDGDKLVGLAAVGYKVSHLITAAQLLVMGNYSGEALHSFMFCHPTLDEILKNTLTAQKNLYSPAC